MADLKSKSPGAKRKAASPARAQRASEKDKAKPKLARSAYLQAKMDVSTPGDPQEQEADRVADEISRMPKGVARKANEEEGVAPGSSGPESNPADEQSIQTKISRQAEKPEASRASSEPETPVNPLMRATEEKTQTKLARAEEEEAQTKLCRAEEEEAQPKLARAEEEEAQTKLARQEQEVDGAETVPEQSEGQGAQTDGTDKPEVSDETEQKIEALRGQGEPLPDNVRREMEEKMEADFSNVDIHTGSEADTLCRQLSARAFTIGSDIFFASGEYAPESEAGRNLLAHELTHVVQQQPGIHTKIHRSTGSSPEPPAGVTPVNPSPDSTTHEYIKDRKRYKYLVGGSTKELQMPEVRIPNFKRRHRALHNSPVRREAGERTTNQEPNWISHFRPLMTTEVDNKISEARSAGAVATGSSGEVYYFRGSRVRQFVVFGTRDELLEHAIIPFWDRDQRPRDFQVDHMREDQLGGEDDESNYELLDAGANGSSGSSIRGQVDAAIRSTTSIFADPYYRDLITQNNPGNAVDTNPTTIKRNYNLQFNVVRYDLGDVDGGDKYWSVRQITQGQHLGQLRPMNERDMSNFANPRHPMLYSSPNGGIGIRIPDTSEDETQLWDRVYVKGPLQVNASDENKATLMVDAYRAGQGPDNRTPRTVYPDVVFYLNAVPGLAEEAEYKSWSIDRTQTLASIASGSSRVFTSLRLPGLSPVTIDSLDIDPNLGFVGRGKLLPSVPLISQADIDLVISGSDVSLQKTFDLNEFDVPSPFSIRTATLTAFMGTQGLGVSGNVAFGIDRVGEGELEASISTEAGFALSGNFNFDERLFGEGTTAQVRMAYENEAWSMGGTITIPQGKVPGVNSATIDVNYSETEGFSARGDAELDIPGVESGVLEISNSEEEGFSVGGEFQLSGDTPGIRGGTIGVTLREKPDGTGYAVSARGEAQPDIPGINSNLSVSYDDGAFTAEVTADYSRGMLSGEVNAGVTNRTVGEDGQLTDTAEEGNPLIVYGGGRLTLQLTPWLQGTAGVQFAPNGEITVTGEIGLPSELEIFPRYEVDRRLFNVAVQYPIVPAVVAEIGGNLTAVAGIGPGTLNELSLGITYNPDHEEDTTITGDASLRVPADAGLRLAIRAGVGVGVPGASVTGGLEITGTLGLEAAAEASVHVEWSPSAGLDFRANLEAHVQPVFTFGIGGYVSARVLGFSVYDESWELASYSYGPDMRFGLELPIHYHEGEPFDISYDDIVWTIPDVSTSDLLSGLMDRIT